MNQQRKSELLEQERQKLFVEIFQHIVDILFVSVHDLDEQYHHSNK
jgi:hypothetical protein